MFKWGLVFMINITIRAALLASFISCSIIIIIDTDNECSQFVKGGMAF